MERSSDPLKILLVEDDEEDYFITRETLAGQERARFAVDWCRDFLSARAAIAEQRHDVYIVDYQLGPRTGLELIREAFSSRPAAPVLMLTSQSEYEIDLEASALGVTDYLLKQELNPRSLERSIRYAVSHHRAVQDLIESEARYALVARASDDGIWDWDLIANTVYLSPRWYEILGLPEVRGPRTPETLFELVHPDDLAEVRGVVDDHLVGRRSHIITEHRMRHADGSWRWVRSRGLAMRDASGTPVRLAGSVTDIADRRAAEMQLEHDALHDALTGLPNRALFMDRTNHLIARTLRVPGDGFAVLFIDIDRFKLVNDSLSHTAGDKLLRALAERMTASLRPEDTVARIGGDEFMVLLDRIADSEQAVAAARRLLEGFSEPFRIDGRELFVTGSVGIALHEPGAAAADLVRNADIAMYEAKRTGPARYSVFDATMRQRQVERLARQNELRYAIEHGLLGVHYQPIVDLQSGAVRGLEALVRWPDDWPPVSPLEFVSIAEEIGLIGQLGEHVLRTATTALRSWRALGIVGPDVHMSVNLSARQLDDRELCDQIQSALTIAGLPVEALRIELTESTLMSDPATADGAVQQLAELGIGLHLDDFGTGYSSLAALHRVPVDALKIDRSFVATIAEGSGGGAIVRSTIALAHNLGLDVIAEGIETVEQMSRLQELGCRCAQGYLFARPQPADAAAATLRTWDPERVRAGQLTLTP